MERTWTEAARLEWIRRRDAHRDQKQLPLLENLRTSDDAKDQAAYRSALFAERRCLLGRLDAVSTKTVSWTVREKPPFSTSYHAMHPS